MAAYSATLPIFQVANGTPAADFMAGQSNTARFIEIGAQVGTAAATVFGVGRSPIPGVQLGAVNLVSEENLSLPCQTTAAVTWSVAPTVPSVYLRRLHISGAAIGQTMVLTFPRGVTLGANGSMVLWNLTTTQAAGTVVWGVVDE